MKKPAKMDAAFTRVRASEDCAVVRPKSEANAVTLRQHMKIYEGYIRTRKPGQWDEMGEAL